MRTCATKKLSQLPIGAEGRSIKINEGFLMLLDRPPRLAI